MNENIAFFHKLYSENLLRVEWSKADLGIGIARGIDPDIKKQINDTTIHDFMNYISEIMDYVTKREYKKTGIFKELEKSMGDDFEKIVSEAERNATLNGPTLDSLDIEYLTKRSYRDIEKIVGYNVRVKFHLSNDEEIDMELDEKQLNVLADAFEVALDELRQLKQ